MKPVSITRSERRTVLVSLLDPAEGRAIHRHVGTQVAQLIRALFKMTADDRAIIGHAIEAMASFKREPEPEPNDLPEAPVEEVAGAKLRMPWNSRQVVFERVVKPNGTAEERAMQLDYWRRLAGAVGLIKTAHNHMDAGQDVQALRDANRAKALLTNIDGRPPSSVAGDWHRIEGQVDDLIQIAKHAVQHLGATR